MFDQARRMRLGMMGLQRFARGKDAQGIRNEKSGAASVGFVVAGERARLEFTLFHAGGLPINHRHEDYGGEQPPASRCDNAGYPGEQVRGVKRMADQAVWSCV